MPQMGVVGSERREAGRRAEGFRRRPGLAVGGWGERRWRGRSFATLRMTELARGMTEPGGMTEPARRMTELALRMANRHAGGWWLGDGAIEVDGVDPSLRSG